MLYYVKIVVNGRHSETHRFRSWREAHEYAMELKKFRRNNIDIWIGQDGEGAVKI